jgi:ArsR family transcriptional regulator
MLELDPRLRLLAHPTRARAVAFLADPVQSCCSRDDGVCACDLETFLEVGQSTVSHHMKALVEAGLVHAEKRGRWVYYDLDAGALRELAANLSALAAVAETNDPTDVEPVVLRERGPAAGVREAP